MAGFFRFLNEKRNDLVRARTRRYLDDDDEVIHWVRIRRPRGRGSGYALLVRRGVLIHLGDEDGESGLVEWDDIKAWGVNHGGDEGPILGIETAERSAYVRLSVPTHGSAGDASLFLEKFAEMAPEPRIDLANGDHLGTFEKARQFRLRKRRRSLAGHTKRVVVTVIGVVLIVVGILLSLPLVPGPGVITIIAGLAILASEYDWADDVLHWAKERFKGAARRVRDRRRRDQK